MTDEEYIQSCKDNLYFIAQNLPEELAIQNAEHRGGYDFDIVLSHKDKPTHLAFTSYRVVDAIKEDRLLEKFNSRHAFINSFEKEPKRRRRRL